MLPLRTTVLEHLSGGLLDRLLMVLPLHPLTVLYEALRLLQHVGDNGEVVSKSRQ